MIDAEGLQAKLSRNLTLSEFLNTSHRSFLASQYTPSPQVLSNARRHAVDVWQPIRDLIGPIHISSGYRCPELNVAVGGALNSAHVEGRATDNIPVECSVLEGYLIALNSGVPYDKIILEFGRWVHLQSAKHGVEPRKQALVIFKPGVYEMFDPNDKRLNAFRRSHV